MRLMLEIEFLSGVSYAAIGPDSDVPDWPPQPDRIFSALVAAWAARGCSAAEQKALQWLERQPPPAILATAAQPRSEAVVFVPPNDPRSDKEKRAKGVLPALRSRQPRRFPAARPLDGTVWLLWPEPPPDDQTFVALASLAQDTAYVGHSASLTRCRFVLGPEPAGSGRAVAAERAVYPGRFAELRRSHDAGVRPAPGASVRVAVAAPEPSPGVFGGEWLVLEHVADDMPDLRACAVVAKAIRDTVLSGYQRMGMGDAIPETVSGHQADGRPTSLPHLAVVPLPFVGSRYADGHVLGFALVPPAASRILRDEMFLRALRAVAPLDEERGRRVLTVATRQMTDAASPTVVRFSPAFEASRQALDPARYLRPSDLFGSVTPIVLDRHLKQKGDAQREEAAEQVAAACQNIGLPRPEQVLVDKHSAVEGAPSAYPPGGAPSWVGWRLPGSMASRGLTHAVIRFSSPVTGPVILGAGRFLGLGLCSPLGGARI